MNSQGCTRWIAQRSLSEHEDPMSTERFMAAEGAPPVGCFSATLSIGESTGQTGEVRVPARRYRRGSQNRRRLRVL
jgi:hypothetical protein